MTSIDAPRIIFVCFALGVIILLGSMLMAPHAIPVYRYEIVHTYPHDRFAFTEGLSYADGFLYEGSGLEGSSSLRKVRLETGEDLLIRNISREYFGEGITVFGNRIAQETEDNGFGFLYNRTTFEPEGIFPYATKGWGITWDGSSLIMSDGTASLTWLDPTTFTIVRQMTVTAQGVPVKNLNELEHVNGEIYANIWPTNRIARISPHAGEITGWIDLSGLPVESDRERIGWAGIKSIRGHTSIPFGEEACLNGIAYDADGNRLFITGKLWPSVYEIRLVPV